MGVSNSLHRLHTLQQTNLADFQPPHWPHEKDSIMPSECQNCQLTDREQAPP